MINRNALFADETASYKIPYEPKSGETVTLILRTLANDVLKAETVINGVSHKMTKFKTDHTFDYYKFSFKCTKKQINYHFVVRDDDDIACYNRLGCVENGQPEFDFSFNPDFSVPDWQRG